MPIPKADCFGLSYNNKFYILSDMENISDQKTIEVFNVEDGFWRSMPDAWQESKKLPICILAIDGRLYTVIDWDGNSIYTRNSETEDWYQVGSVPAITLSNHPRPLEPFDYSLCSLKKELYVIGGKAIKFEDQGGRRFDILKLGNMRVCNPFTTPLQWRETRPFLGPACGVILGCESLEENVR